jgi:solute carrier family 25 S-adenosylmethionine transporter 26
MESSGTGATMATIRRFRSHPASLFRGYTALAMRNLPFTALQFPMFEAARERIWRYRKVVPEEATLTERALVTAVAAGGAGGIAAVITTPVDVVKTRVMLRAASVNKTQPGEWTVFKNIFKEEGVKGLWRGGALRGIWTIVGSGLYLGVYDLGRVYLGRRRGIEVEDID